MADLVDSFWRTITAHGPLLMLVVPCFGAAFAFFGAALGPAFVRRTALTNAGLSCLVALSIALSPPFFSWRTARPVDDGGGAGGSGGESGADSIASDTPPRAGRPVLVSSLVWARLPPIDGSPHRIELRFSTGIDGVRLPFLVMLAFVMLAGLLCLPGNEEATCWQAPLILLWQSALLGVVVAQDIGLWTFCLFSAGLPPTLWLGLEGGPDGRERAVRRAMAWFGGSVATLSAALGLAAACARMLEQTPRVAATVPPTFDLTTILLSIEAIAGRLESSQSSWSTERLTYGLCAAVAALLLLPVAPWERPMPAARPVPRSVRVILVGGAALVGPLVLLRLVAPARLGLLDALPVPFAFNALALWLALRDGLHQPARPMQPASHEGDGHDPAKLLGVVVCVATGAVATDNAAARCGAVLMLLNCAAGCAAAAAFGRAARTTPHDWRRRFAAVLPALFLAPPFAGFVGVWMITAAFFRDRGSVWHGVLAGGLGLAALAVAAFRVVRAPVDISQCGDVEDQIDAPSSSRLVTALVVLVIVASLALGVWPEPVVRHMMEGRVEKRW